MDNEGYLDASGYKHERGEREMTSVCRSSVVNVKRQFIDFEMIPAKITYFLNDGYYGSINPFMNIFYVSLGLTAAQAGTISGISFVVAFVAVPLWGMLADATGHRKLIYLALCIGTGSTVFSIPWIARAITTNDNVTCIETYTHNMSSHVQCSSSPSLKDPHSAVYILMTINIIAFMFFPSLACYIHGIVMNVVNTREKKTNYGPQKVYSSIGYAFFNFCSGLLCEYFSPNWMPRYTAPFFIFLGCIFFITPSGYYLVGQGKWEKNERRDRNKTPIIYHLLSVFKKLDTLVFLMTVAITGIANNIFQCFTFMLMTDTMESSKTVMSLAVASCVVAELMVFPISSHIIKFCRGPIISMGIGTLSFLPRFMLMTYVRNQWLMLPIQLFHGLGLSLSWAAEMEYSYKIFPNEIKLTAITIVSSIYLVASGAIANILGGIIYNQFGGVVLFRGTAVFCGAWTLFMTLYYGIKRKIYKHRVNINPQNAAKEFEVTDINEVPCTSQSKLEKCEV